MTYRLITTDQCSDAFHNYTVIMMVVFIGVLLLVAYKCFEEGWDAREKKG